MQRKLSSLAARGLLKLLGGAATLAATACADYGMPSAPDATLVGADTAYGPSVYLDATRGPEDAAYGPPACTTDTECGETGSQWYCGPAGWCEFGTRPDAGSDDDAGE